MLLIKNWLGREIADKSMKSAAWPKVVTQKPPLRSLSFLTRSHHLRTIECGPRIDLPPIAIAESFQMTLPTLTVAHISPIISLIAGVLILIMPRLLNFIVAGFLILNGLLGLGLLRWLHL
jgi:hypothetical protein